MHPVEVDIVFYLLGNLDFAMTFNFVTLQQTFNGASFRCQKVYITASSAHFIP